VRAAGISGFDVVALTSQEMTDRPMPFTPVVWRNRLGGAFITGASTQ
jgi:hypothetical protein